MAGGGGGGRGSEAAVEAAAGSVAAEAAGAAPTSAGTLVFTLTFATCGDPFAPATALGTVPVTLPFVSDVFLLFVEFPRKYAAANAAAPIATAIRRILTVLLILNARL